MALKEACSKIGLELIEGQTKYKWYGSQKKKCLHAIIAPGKNSAYEIGVNQKNEVFTLSFDPHNGGNGLTKLCGAKCSKLIAIYTQVVAIKEATKFAQAQGWSVTEEFDKDTDETVIRLRKY